MNQEKIVLEFVKAVCETDEPDYAELVLLSVTESPRMADFIKRVFQIVRARRPLLLEMKGPGQYEK